MCLFTSGPRATSVVSHRVRDLSRLGSATSKILSIYTTTVRAVTILDVNGPSSPMLSKPPPSSQPPSKPSSQQQQPRGLQQDSPCTFSPRNQRRSLIYPRQPSQARPGSSYLRTLVLQRLNLHPHNTAQLQQLNNCQNEPAPPPVPHPRPEIQFPNCERLRRPQRRRPDPLTDHQLGL